MTRNERRRKRRRQTALMCAAAILLTWLFIFLAVVCRGEERPESRVVYYEPGREPPDYAEADNEADMVALAVIGAVGTEDEIAVVGYDISYVAKVVMAESGANSELLQRAVCQCIFNRAVRFNVTPEEVARKCYTAPADEVSDSVWAACFAVLIRGERCEEIGKADMCYNPVELGKESPDHECQKYCCTIENVKFYEEIL